MLIEFQAIILPITAALVAQLMKVFIKSNAQKFNLAAVFAYSGMPSGHSAFVISLATIIGLVWGFNSASFAISLTLAIIVIRDALGIRRYLGQHGHALNIIINDLNNKKIDSEHLPRLMENIGHTPLQAIAGSIVGVLISGLGFLIIN